MIRIHPDRVPSWGLDAEDDDGGPPAILRVPVALAATGVLGLATGGRSRAGEVG